MSKGFASGFCSITVTEDSLVIVLSQRLNDCFAFKTGGTDSLHQLVTF